MENDAPETLLDVDPAETPPGEIDVETVRAGLTVEDNLVRTRAAQLGAVLAGEDTERAVSLVPRLLDRLAADDDHPVILKEVLSALVLIADERPATLDDAIPALVSLLNHDLPLLRTFAARVIRPLATTRPERFVPHVVAILDTLAREDPEVMEGLEPPPGSQLSPFEAYRSVQEEEQRRQIAARGVAANLLVAVAETDPDALRSRIPALLDLLDSEDSVVVAASAEAIANVAQENPDAASAATQPLCDCLDSPDETVVARAITVLGFIRDTDAVGPLRTVADDADADEDLRALAAETADWLDANAD